MKEPALYLTETGPDLPQRWHFNVRQGQISFTPRPA